MDKKINVSEKLHTKISLVCFLSGISQKDFIESLVKDFLKDNPLPKKIEIKDFSLKLTK